MNKADDDIIKIYFVSVLFYSNDNWQDFEQKEEISLWMINFPQQQKYESLLKFQRICFPGRRYLENKSLV